MVNLRAFFAGAKATGSYAKAIRELTQKCQDHSLEVNPQLQAALTNLI